MPPKKKGNKNKGNKPAIQKQIIAPRVTNEPTELHNAIIERDYQKLLSLFLTYQHTQPSSATLFEHPFVNTLSKWSTLHLSIINGQKSIVEFLVDRCNANPNLPYENENGQQLMSPLAMAVLQEDISMCKILIERGADLTTQQNKNLTSVVPESIAEEFCSLVQESEELKTNYQKLKEKLLRKDPKTYFDFQTMKTDSLKFTATSELISTYQSKYINVLKSLQHLHNQQEKLQSLIQQCTQNYENLDLLDRSIELECLQLKQKLLVLEQKQLENKENKKHSKQQLDELENHSSNLSNQLNLYLKKEEKYKSKVSKLQYIWQGWTSKVKSSAGFIEVPSDDSFDIDNDKKDEKDEKDDENDNENEQKIVEISDENIIDGDQSPAPNGDQSSSNDADDQPQEKSKEDDNGDNKNDQNKSNQELVYEIKKEEKEKEKEVEKEEVIEENEGEKDAQNKEEENKKEEKKEEQLRGETYNVFERFDVDDVVILLKEIGLAKYAKFAEQNQISGAKLISLTEKQILDQLKIKILGHRKILFYSIEKLKRNQFVPSKEEIWIPNFSSTNLLQFESANHAICFDSQKLFDFIRRLQTPTFVKISPIISSNRISGLTFLLLSNYDLKNVWKISEFNDRQIILKFAQSLLKKTSIFAYHTPAFAVSLNK